ncbi:hypothetical protein CNEO4_170019 [Clostridium neonatale]|nr:hypothetical protein CNEO4_170019 [Clostridium neonatale]
MFFGKDKKNLIKYKHIKIYKKKHCYRAFSNASFKFISYIKLINIILSK